MDAELLRSTVETWIADDPDPSTQAEAAQLLRDPRTHAELEDRFRGRLRFGTAGLRGVLAAGPARMNRATVATATWAVARVLLASVPRAADRGVVVGGDARRMSPEFCDDVGAILAGAGLRVFLFSSPEPTPLIAFVTKRFGAAAGIAITASHNPAAYSGYKLYWDDAAQIVPPIDRRIESEIDRAPPARQITRPPLEALIEAGRLRRVGSEVEREYLDTLREGRGGQRVGERRSPLSIVYTPLHGVGSTLAVAALREAGFSAVIRVPEQDQPDPMFPTVAFPNPEEPGTMDLSLRLASRVGADLVLANDPDADRLAVGVRHQGKLAMLTGNEVGVLLGYHLLRRAAPPAGRRAVISTIVSSPMLGIIARDLGAVYAETLTGFKWIVNRALALEAQGVAFLFGFEEALGYCVGGAVRDKDGISAATVVAELAEHLRAEGRTLVDALDELALRWGAFASDQLNVTETGPGGPAAITGRMARLRDRCPTRLAGEEVVAVTDYLAGKRRLTGASRSTGIALPPSDVLSFELSSGSRVVARPSGTEPKAKVYVDVVESVRPGEPPSVARSRAIARAAELKEAFRAHLGT